jgi:hypothetical protein
LASGSPASDARAQAVPSGGADASGLHVRVELLASCPSAKLLREQLAVLLPAGTRLAVNTDAPAAGALAASLRDQGSSFSVTADGVEREVDDPARDCVERARVAAVFIALNVQPKLSAAQAAEGEDEDAAGGWGVELELFAAAAYASEIDRMAPGAGVGVWFARESWRLAFHAAVLAPADVGLEAAPGVSGDVGLLRVPLVGSAAYLFAADTVEIGPALGLELDVLRMRGQGVERPETELRLNPGAMVGAVMRARLSHAFSALLRLSLSAFPRAYELTVDPSGQLGATPRLWLGAALGVGWAP